MIRVLWANKGVRCYDLRVAHDYAQRESLVSFRVSIFVDNKKVATYEWGKVVG